MTDTASKQAKTQKSNNGMRSTHPAYSEYGWSDITGQSSGRPGQQPRVNPNQPRPAQPIRQGANQAQRPQRANSYAASAAAPARANRPVSAPVDPRSRRQGSSSGQTRGSDPRREAEHRREAELRREAKQRREAEQRRENARRLADEAKKRTEAAAKEAARQAKKAQAKALQALRELNTIKSDSRYTFPLSIILTALAFTVLVLAIVTTSVRISEITTENSALKRTYDSLTAEEDKLRMELEVRDDLRTVENLAKNEYGMVKQDQVERYYLKTYQSDRIELVEETEDEKSGVFDGIASLFRSIGDRILSFFGK